MWGPAVDRALLWSCQPADLSTRVAGKPRFVTLPSSSNCPGGNFSCPGTCSTHLSVKTRRKPRRRRVKYPQRQETGSFSWSIRSTCASFRSHSDQNIAELPRYSYEAVMCRIMRHLPLLWRFYDQWMSAQWQYKVKHRPSYGPRLRLRLAASVTGQSLRTCPGCFNLNWW